MKKIIPVLCAILPSISFAAINETILDRTITQINSYHDRAVIFFEPSYANNQECTSSESNRVVIRFEEDTKTRKEIYSLALSAATSGKIVNIGIYDCDGDYPSVYRLDVKF